MPRVSQDLLWLAAPSRVLRGTDGMQEPTSSYSAKDGWGSYVRHLVHCKHKLIHRPAHPRFCVCEKQMWK